MAPQRVIPTRTFPTLASVPRHSNDSVKAHLRVRALEIMQQDSSVMQLDAMEQALVEWNAAARANIEAGKRMGAEAEKNLRDIIEAGKRIGAEAEKNLRAIIKAGKRMGKQLQAILDEAEPVTMADCPSPVIQVPAEPNPKREVMGEDPECIADGDSITLWDCKCPECRSLQRES